MPNSFGSPGFLILLGIIPVFVYMDLFYFKWPGLGFSNNEWLKPFKDYSWLTYILTGLKTLALIMIIIALARPQHKIAQKPVYNSGVDIMIVQDASGSMAAEDLAPNRLEAAKDIMKEFVLARRHDRIGLVVFGVNAVTKIPLTFDREILLNVIDKIKLGEMGDGTAIGQALATALNRLRDSEAKSKVIILVTDGENNAGKIGPKEAAKLANQLEIKIYTVGIGTAEGAPMIVYDPVYGKQYARNYDGTIALTKLNLEELVAVAELSSGRFFQAKNNSELKEIYQQIDRLEKVELKAEVNYMLEERFAGFVFFALLFILTELIISRTILRIGPCI